MSRQPASAWAPLPLRLVLGAGLSYHGGIKLFADGGHANISYLIASLGVPFPELFGWVAGVVEFAGGLALLVGLWTRYAAAVNAANVAVLLVLAGWRGGIPAPLPGGDPLPHAEFAALILAGTLALTLAGAGPWSYDRTRRRRVPHGIASGSNKPPTDPLVPQG